MITQIQPLKPIDKMEETAQLSAGIAGQGAGANFQSYIEAAIDHVRQTDAEKVHADYLLSTGQLDNPSSLMIAAAKNEIAVTLLVQLRNKALDAYSELTRMSM